MSRFALPIEQIGPYKIIRHTFHSPGQRPVYTFAHPRQEDTRSFTRLRNVRRAANSLIRKNQKEPRS